MADGRLRICATSGKIKLCRPSPNGKVHLGCETVTCVQCGTCCYDSGSVVTITWSLKDGVFVWSDLTSTPPAWWAGGDPSTPNADGLTALAVINAIRTGIVILPFRLSIAGPMEAKDPLDTDERIIGVEKECVGGVWSLHTNQADDFWFWGPNAVGFANWNAYLENDGDSNGEAFCCGITPESTLGPTQLSVQHLSDTTIGAISPLSYKLSIQATSRCCYNTDTEECEVVGTEQCDTSVDDTDCSPGV